MSTTAEGSFNHDDVMYPSAIPFMLVHTGCFAALWSGVTYDSLLLGILLYWLRMFAIGAGYHRYFSHRSYSTGRVFQFILAFLAQSSAQKSVLWWAAKHRHHHLHADTQEDVHSPMRTGFIYSHVGWIFMRQHDVTDLTKVADLARFPELRCLHQFELVPPVVLGILCFLLAGWPGLVVGFLWSTVLVYHATFCINSLAHVRGRKRFLTADESRNNWLLAIFTMGEGWHNNHHAYQSSARQGFRWWELDATYYILRALAAVGAVWDLKMPPERVLRNQQRLGARVIARAAEQLAAHFNSSRTSSVISAAVHGPELVAVREALLQAQQHSTGALKDLHLLAIPSREQILVEAKKRFPSSVSLEEIADRAYTLVLEAIGGCLAGGSFLPADACRTDRRNLHMGTIESLPAVRAV